MKKTCLSALIVVLFSIHTSAQQLNWQWAQGSTGPVVGNSGNVATDPGGNVYLSGITNPGILQFGSVSLAATVQNTGFVVKYNSSGQALWATNVGFRSRLAYNLACDRQGNILLAGYIAYDSAAYGGPTCIMKLDSTGTLLWVDTPGYTNGNVVFNNVSADSMGNVYVNGYSSSGNIFVFGTDTIRSTSSPGAYSVFLLKYDPSGNLLWVHEYNGAVGYMSLAADPAGGGYLWYSAVGRGDSAVIDTVTVTFPIITSPSAVIRFNSSGRVLWAKPVYGYSLDIGNMATDQAGDLYITGWSYDSIIVSNKAKYYPSTVTGEFVAKLDNSGAALWIDAAITAGYSGVRQAIAADDQGRVYMCSPLFGDQLTYDSVNLQPSNNPIVDQGFVLGLDGTDGHLLCWQVLPYGGGEPSGLSTDDSGNVYYGGVYSEDIFIAGTDTLRDNQLTNLYITKFLPCADTKGPNSITDISSSQTALSIHPNPSSGLVTVSYILPDAVAATICMTDMLGNKINDYTLPCPTGELSINTSALDKGIYILSLINNGSKASTRKLVVE